MGALTYGRTDVRSDGRTEVQGDVGCTDGRTDGHANNPISISYAPRRPKIGRTDGRADWYIEKVYSPIL